MGELVTFTPELSANGKAAQSGLPATIIIFPGVRYEREGRQSAIAAREGNSTADGTKV